MITKKKNLNIEDSFIQDDKVNRGNPDFTSYQNWLATTYMGYKESETRKLTLKKSEDKSEIYDGDKLLASYEKNGNFFWLGIPTLTYEIFGRAKDLKKAKKDEFKKIDETYFNVENLTHELTQEEIDREFLNARGKMAGKIRELFKKTHGEDGTMRLQYGNEEIEANADAFVEYIKESFKAQFNKYGLSLSHWVFDGLVSDRDLKFKRRLTMALNQLVKEDDAKYNDNFNGLDPREIMEEYAGAVKAAIRKEKEEINNMPVEHKGYTIVRVKDEAHAKSFRKFVALPGASSAWCITGGSYPNYIDPLSGKAEVFYVLLKDGYQDFKDVPRNGHAKDEYGVSMIMVSVRQDGSIQTATPRDNHGRGGGDNIFTDVELSKLIGKSIYKACPPLSSPLDLLRDIKVKGQSYLKSDSNGFRREVKYYGGFLYIIENGQIMTDTWDSILKFNNIVLVKKIKGDIDSETIGYVLIQKLLRNEDTMTTDSSTVDFFIGMDLGLNMIYGPTKKGDIFTVLREVRKLILEGAENESQS